jgi:hypothetical protein
MRAGEILDQEMPTIGMTFDTLRRSSVATRPTPKCIGVQNTPPLGAMDETVRSGMGANEHLNSKLHIQDMTRANDTPGALYHHYFSGALSQFEIVLSVL